MEETSTNFQNWRDNFRNANKLGVARRAGFYLSVLVFLFFWLLAFNFVLYASVVGWFDPILSATIHYVHDIALASWVWVWGLAMLVQLYRPVERVTAMQVAVLLTSIDLGVGLAAAGFFGGTFDPSVMLFFGPVYVAAALHPARGELLRLGPFDREHVTLPLLGLAAVAAVPVGLYVAGQANLQFTLTDEHTALGHYATMVYFGLSFVALAALAAFGNRGRRFPAYAAGLMAVLFAAASVYRPTASGLDLTWSVLAVLWGLAVIGTYEWAASRRRTPRADRSIDEPTTTG